MFAPILPATIEKFTTFGDLLRFLRRRAGLTQMELAAEVGYSDTQISRLEQNQRLPDIPTIEARFVSALGLMDEPETMARLLDLAANIRREDAPASGLCPYKGLSYFDETDADLFAGRETLTAFLVDQVLSKVSDANQNRQRFLAVVGASGSGKSSLVRAGLVPSLRWNKSSAEWAMVIFTPTAHPLESLALAMTGDRDSPAATALLMDSLAQDSRSLHLFARRTLDPLYPGRRLLLVVDQFEELFALCRTEAERSAFIGNLLTASSEAQGPVIVIIALRADFYAHCAAYGGLRDALSTNQQYIGAMDDEELRRAIEEPAQRGRWDFEPGLIDLLLHDAGHEPGALPLLSHALLETWQRRRARMMTLSGYISSHGVHGAIAETAETVFNDQFTREQQAIARRIFLRLTELNDETAAADTRRRATISELILKPEDAASTLAVLKALADARLITTAENSAEVAHEALIREWPTLRGWLEENREDLRLHRQLTEAAAEWLAAGREEGILYRGARLAQAAEWAAAHSEEMNGQERDFLVASLEAAERDTLEREAQRQRELDAMRKLAEAETQRAEEQLRSAVKLRRRAIYLSGAFLAALIMAILAVFYWNQTRQTAITAQENERLAASRELAAAAVSNLGIDPERSILLALRALETESMGGEHLLLPEAEAALHQAVIASHLRRSWNAHEMAISRIVYSPDGNRLATASRDGTTKIWDAVSGQEMLTLPVGEEEVRALAFSPDSAQLAANGDGGLIHIWETATGRLLKTISDSASPVTDIGFSPDGLHLVSGSSDGSIVVRDANDGRKLDVLTGGFESLANDAFQMTDSGIQIAGMVANTVPSVRIWKPSSVRERWLLEGNGQLAFSPDERHIAAAWMDGTTVNIWTLVANVPEGVAGHMLVARLTGHTGFVNSISYSPDGARLATAGQDGIANLWDAASGQKLLTLTGHAVPIHAVAFSPDGAHLATGDEKGELRIWDTGPDQELFSLAAPITSLRQVHIYGAPTFSPDGTRLLAIANTQEPGLGTRSKVIVVDGLDGRNLLTLANKRGVSGDRPPASLALSPDGRMLAVGYEDGEVQVVDSRTGDLLLSLTTAPVFALAFSPDSRWLAVPGSGSMITLWDVARGEPAFTLGFWSDLVHDLAFSPDGKRLAAAVKNQRPKIWDLASRQSLFEIPGRSALAVIYSPDGTRLAVARDNGTIAIHDADAGQELYALSGNWGLVSDLAFSPDAASVAAAAGDGTARVWDLASGQPVLTVPGGSSVAFSPDGRRLATVGGSDLSLRVYLVKIDDLIALARSRLTRTLTLEECRQYLHVQECPADLENSGSP